MIFRTIRVALVALLLMPSAVLVDTVANARDNELLRQLGNFGARVIINEIERRNTRTQHRNQSSTARNPYAAAEPRINNADSRSVQRALNTLGFNVGEVDGKIGSGTRRSIKSYQASIGAQPTGYLSSSQLANLVEIGRSADARYDRQSADDDGRGQTGDGVDTGAPLTVAEIRLLQKSLNALGYSAGSVDGKLGRGTGRAVSRFLTDRNRDPDTTAPREALQLAAQLAGFEYRIERGDSEFTAADPQTGEVSVFDLVAENLDSADFEDAVNDSGFVSRGGLDAFTPVEMDDPQISQAVGTGSGVKNLIAMIVAVKPGLLDDQDILKSLYEYEGGTFSSSYRVEETLAAYRNELSQRPAPTTARLNLQFDGVLAKGNFSKDRGIFEIDYSPFSFVPKRFMDIRTKILGNLNRIGFELANLPDLSGIPMNLEEAEAFERNFARDKHNFTTTSVYVVIHSISFDANRNRFVADAELVATVLRKKFDDEALVHAWPVDGAALGQLITEDIQDAGDFVDFMGGMRTVNDHLAYDRNATWDRFYAALLLGAKPDAMADDATAISLSETLLFQNELDLLWQGKKSNNEFDLKDTADKIRNAFGDSIGRRAVRAPFKIVEIRDVDLERYDFDARAYPLRYDTTKDIEFRVRDASPAVLRGTWGNTFLPGNLEIPEDFARKLDGVMRAKANRRFYLAIFADIDQIGQPQPGGRGRYDLPVSPKVTRIALYADPSLQKLVFDYYGEQGSSIKKLQEAKRNVFDVLAIKPTVFELQVRTVDRLSRDPEYLKQMVRTSNAYERANELEREDLEAEILASYAGLGDPREFWLWGEAELGSYDFERQGFPVSGLGISDPGSDLIQYKGQSLRYDGEIKHEIIGDLGFVPMPKETAKEFLAKYPERKFTFRMRTEPASAIWKESYSGPEATIAHAPREMYLLIGERDRDDRAKSILARLTYEAGDPGLAGNGVAAAGTAAPAGIEERPLLTRDLVNSVAMSVYQGQVSERSLRWLVANQWLADQTPIASLGRNYFSAGAQAPTAATMALIGPRYLEWAKANPVSIPVKLRIEIENASNPMYLDGGITVGINDERRLAFCHHLEYGIDDEVAVRAGLGDPYTLRAQQSDRTYKGTVDAPAVIEPFLARFQDSPFTCTSRTGENLAEALVPEARDWQPGMVVVFDRMPAPPVQPTSDAFIIEADVTVTAFDLVDNPGEFPHAVLRVAFEKARYIRLENGERVPAYELDREAIEPKTATANDGGAFDVVGIRVGMTLDEADAAVRQHMADPIVLESQTQPSLQTPPFNHGRMYVTPQKNERITLYYEDAGEAPTVLAVERVVSAPNWGIPREAVAQAARQKYGAPVLEEYGEYGTEMVWGDNVGAMDESDYPRPSQCKLSSSQNRIEDWSDSSGATQKIYEFFNWDEIRNTAMGTVPHLDYFLQPEFELYGECGAYVRLKQNSEALETFVTDLDAYAASYIRARELVEKRFKSDAAASAASLPEVKL